MKRAIRFKTTCLVSAKKPLLMKHLLPFLLCYLLASTGCAPRVVIEEKPGDFNIEMPTVGQAENDDAVNFEVAIGINANGDYEFKNELIEQPELESYLAELTEEHETLTLLIIKDDSAPYDRLVKLMKIATKAGVETIRFE